jgi:hypothetical protein
MTLDPVKQLRDYIADPKNGTELFDDPELEDYITTFGGDLHAAAAELWGIKAATVATWYQMNVDGSYMAREQVFEHCLKMQTHHRSFGSSTSDPVDSGYVSTTVSAEF